MLFNMKNIQKADLQALIDNQVFENRELEYKDYSFVGGKLPDKQKDKFMKEIAAFANTNGGTIIIGMQEDENRLPIKLSGAGMGLGDFDAWLSSFKQMVLSRIRPHLHGIDCMPVELDDNNIAIVISIPKSYARPHSCYEMTFFKGKSQRNFTCQIVQNTKRHLKGAKRVQISGIGHSVIRGLVTTGQWFSASTTVYRRGSPQGRRHSYFVDC